MSFKFKTIFGIAIIETVLLFILIVTSLNLLKTTKESELVKLATSTAELFATTTKDALLATDLAALDSFMVEVMKNSGLLYARVISNEIGTLAESYKDIQLKTEFVRDHSIRDVQDGIFDTYAVIAESGFEYGRVELGFSIDEIDVLVDKAKRKTFMIAIVELCLSALFSLMLGFYLTRQLSELTLASKKITQGELGFSVRVKGHDELAETAKAFNKMSLNLKKIWSEKEEAQQQLIQLNEALEQKVIQRTQELEEAQNNALESAHRAGMADVAAGALHNIGNLINSAKTSTNLLIQEVQSSKIKKIHQANALLKANIDDLEHFILRNPKGKSLLEYYLSLEEVLDKEQISIRQKLQDIEKSIESTAQTILEQQAYAKNPLRFETDVDIQVLFEEIFVLVKPRIVALDIQISTQYPTELKAIRTQRNKLHQVLFNLIINAMDAIEMSTAHRRGTVHVAVAQHQGTLVIEVTDNGCGIALEKIDTIFNYGFTTKAAGNGAGLHSSANLMTEMMGKLSVKSDGEGYGATFILELPF